MWVGNQRHAPATLPLAMARHSLYSRQGVPQDQSSGVRKIAPPTRFYHLIVQPVASRCTYYAIPTQTDYSVWIRNMVAHIKGRGLRVFQNRVLRRIFGRDNRGVEKIT